MHPLIVIGGKGPELCDFDAKHDDFSAVSYERVNSLP
jgi:hypothetical protein